MITCLDPPKWVGGWVDNGGWRTSWTTAHYVLPTRFYYDVSCRVATISQSSDKNMIKKMKKVYSFLFENILCDNTI